MGEGARRVPILPTVRRGDLDAASGSFDRSVIEPFGAHRRRPARSERAEHALGVVAEWYRQRRDGEITSANFQLHPPRNRNDNVVRSICGNLEYPLLFCAELVGRTFAVTHYDAAVLTNGACRRAH